MTRLVVWAWISVNKHGAATILSRNGELLVSARKDVIDRPSIERELQWHASQQKHTVQLVQLTLNDTLRTLVPKQLTLVPRALKAAARGASTIQPALLRRFAKSFVRIAPIQRDPDHGVPYLQPSVNHSQMSNATVHRVQEFFKNFSGQVAK